MHVNKTSIRCNLAYWKDYIENVYGTGGNLLLSLLLLLHFSSFYLFSMQIMAPIFFFLIFDIFVLIFAFIYELIIFQNWLNTASKLTSFNFYFFFIPEIRLTQMQMTFWFRFFFHFFFLSLVFTWIEENSTFKSVDAHSTFLYCKLHFWYFMYEWHVVKNGFLMFRLLLILLFTRVAFDFFFLQNENNKKYLSSLDFFHWIEYVIASF